MKEFRLTLNTNMAFMGVCMLSMSQDMARFYGINTSDVIATMSNTSSTPKTYTATQDCWGYLEQNGDHRGIATIDEVTITQVDYSGSIFPIKAGQIVGISVPSGGTVTLTVYGLKY